MPCSLADIQADACVSGIGREQSKIKLLQLIAQLTCEAAEGGGTAGGCFQCSSGAGAPVAAPTVATQPAQYRDTASGFNYRWDVQSQSWVAIPKVYKALLTQTGTDAPVATVLSNTIGAGVWSRQAVGNYRFTLVGAFPASTFTTSNVFSAGIDAAAIMGRVTDDYVTLISYEGGSPYTVLADNSLEATPVEIEVYP